jgi:hypothetical protein
MDKCQYKYNAESYYYDNNGTQMCYCGNIKSSCEKYKNVTIECKDNSNVACKLVATAVINSKLVPTINDNETCKKQCQEIMNSSTSIYCPDDEKKCVCIDPNIKPNPIPPPSPSPLQPTDGTCDSNQMKCPDNSNILTISNNQNDLSTNYFSIGKLFGNEEGSSSVINAFCGCDKSVIKFYNKAFKDTNAEKRPTLDSIWIDSVKKSIDNPNIDLETTFANQLNIETKGSTDKLRALVAYEMCRITNNQYSRILDKQCPNPSKNFGGWLNCHLNAKESLSGKWLNIILKILVMLMLVHILFRTFIPKQTNVKDSLIFAMFMPPQFLQGQNQLKGGILGLTISIMLMIITISYSSGSSNLSLVMFGSIITLFVCLTAFGLIKNKYYFILSGIFGLIVSNIILFIINSENPDKSENDSSDFNKKCDNINNPVFWILIVFLLLLIPIGIYGVIKKNNLFKSISIVLIPALIAALIVIQLKPKGFNEGKAFSHYFIPTELKELPYSGLAFSIYAIFLGAILTKSYSSWGITGKWTTALFIGILILSGILYLLYTKIKDNDSDTDIDNVTNKYIKSYFILICIFIVISGISGIIGNFGGSEYFIPYIISTVFGILPLAIFLIIINFVIANYSPAIELLFLVLYRFSSSLISMTPNNSVWRSIGEILLKIIGKRSNDKWVLPFLPFLSNFVELFYLVTGDTKPGYFNSGKIITGVSNTDLWLS